MFFYGSVVSVENPVVACCKSGRPFAEKVVSVLREKYYHNLELLDTSEIDFPNTELKTINGRSIRGTDYFLIQDFETDAFGQSNNDALFASYTALAAAHHSEVGRKTLIALSFPYARQDKSAGREGIMASTNAQTFEDSYGVDRMVSMDVHNEAIAGFFRKANFMNLRAVHDLSSYINRNIKYDYVIFADSGGHKRAEDFSVWKGNDKPVIGFHKVRDNVSGKITSQLLGKVKGKKCLILEDMVDTSGTLVKSCKRLKKAGAKKVYCAATHGLFNGPAVEKLSKLYYDDIIDGVICTDSIYHPPEFMADNPWYQEVSVAAYVAKAIDSLHLGRSVSALLND